MFEISLLRYNLQSFRLLGIRTELNFQHYSLNFAFENMTRPKRASEFSVKDIQDSGETPELVIVEESKEQKRGKFLDYVEGRKRKSLNELHNSKMLHVKDGGGGSKTNPLNLEIQNPVKRNRQSQTVVSATQCNGGKVCQGFGRSNSPHKQKNEFSTTSKTQNSFCRRPMSRPSVKVAKRCEIEVGESGCSTPDVRIGDFLASYHTVNLNDQINRLLRKVYLDDFIITKNDESKLNQDAVSCETFTGINTPNSSSLRRRSSRVTASLDEQVGAYDGDSLRRIKADQLRLCSICNKNSPNLFSAPGYSLSLCPACRRKSEAADPTFSLNADFQACAAESPASGQKKRNHSQKKDVKGRTPDTAMEIESSDDEEAANDFGYEQRRRTGLQSTAKRMEGCKIAYPSTTDPEAIEILASDIQRLEPLEFLNDTIIDFYIKYIQTEILNLESGRRFHFFNSFFYKKLSDVVGKKVCKKKKKRVVDFTKLRKWTRGINIFEKDYLVIPVHDKLHWSLAIICFPNHASGGASRCERCILHLDSMTCGHESLTVFRLLRRYIVAEWKDKFGGSKLEGDNNNDACTWNAIPGRKVPVPQQENESDCGLFLLHYIRKFVESAPRTMKIRDVEDRLEDLGLFGRRWFIPAEASSLRTSIQEQLQRLFAQNRKALGTSNDTSLGISDVCIPRNLEAEFGHVSVL